MRIEIELPYPPSLNRYYRAIARRVLISREGRAYRRTVCAALAEAGTEPLDGPLCLRIEVYPPDRRRRDLDNTLKATLDALEHGGAYGDDSQIVKLIAEKRAPVPGGRAIVRIDCVKTSDANPD